MRVLQIAALSVLAATMSPADAALSSRYDYQTAAGVCQGALPAFAGTLRARPLAIANEGSTTAFITCGLRGSEPGFNRTISRAFVTLGNGSATTSTVSCTWVHGFGTSSDTQFIPKSIQIDPGEMVFLSLRPTDLTGAEPSLKWPQISCQLPPGGIVYYTGVLYEEEIGS